MLRKMMIALVGITFIGALAGSTPADARGGGFGGGGMHMGGGFSGGGMHGFSSGGFRTFSGGGFRAGFAGARFGTAGFAGRPFTGPGHFAFRPGFAFRNHVFFRNRFFPHGHFAFAAVPFGVGLGFYGASCWSWQPTPWGWQRVWVCGNGY